jgi:2-oxoisovalerate dehydrogenase E1 component
VIPIGKARVVQEASNDFIKSGESVGVITYGRGVYWTIEACKEYSQHVEILDLRSLNPIDEEAMFALAKRHGKIMIVTEESTECTFGLSLLGRIQQHCFQSLDAPIALVGSVDTPAIPLNSDLEAAILPNAQKVDVALRQLLNN